jgi:hypothetical protein
MVSPLMQLLKTNRKEMFVEKQNTDSKEYDYALMDLKTYASSAEESSRGNLRGLLDGCPIPYDQLLSNLGLFLESKQLARILFMDHIYKLAMEAHGVIIEFGTHWGQNTALFTALRGIYEPFNRHRKIIGFDTFQGFPSLSEKDGGSELMKLGKLNTGADYPAYLRKLLDIHQSLNPLSHIEKNEICVGDASIEFRSYLDRNPQTIVSLVYFDFDLYEPTKRCLELVIPRLVKGSVVGFDELNDPDSPGETLALMESFGLNKVRLKRFPHASRVSYFVLE